MVASFGIAKPNKRLNVINSLILRIRGLRVNNYLWIVLAFSWYGIYLRLKRLHSRELWCDEISQLQSMQGPFKPFWQKLSYGDVTAFPGEYILSFFFVNTPGVNKWWLAIPHLFFTILGFCLLYILCRKYMHSWVGFTVTFLIYALNDNLVYHSLEFRPYAVLPVLALASLYIAHTISEKFAGMSFFTKIFIGLSIVGIINFHAYGLFIFTLPIVYILLILAIDLSRKGQNPFQIKHLLPWNFLVISVGIAMAIWLWYASYTTKQLHNTFQYIANPLVDPVSFLKSVVGNLMGNRFLYIFLLGCLPVFSHSQRLKQLVFLSILVILPIEIILFFDLKAHYWFLQRQFVWVMPFLAIWVGWSLDSVYLFVRRK